MKDKRGFLFIIGFLVVLAGVGFWGYRQSAERRQLEVTLNNNYYSTFYELTENVQSLTVLLSKILVAEAPNQDRLIFMEIWQRANAAQINLTQLPLPDAMMVRTSKYFTQVGDYAYSFFKSGTPGTPTVKTKKEWETLNRLYKKADSLNTELVDLEKQLSQGKLYLSELKKGTSGVIQREKPKLAKASFNDIEKHMEDLPVLIYDGPFSEHLEKRKPMAINGARISAPRAQSIALTFVERQSSNGKYRVEKANLDRGKIPAYRVELVSRHPLRPKEGKVTLAVSQQGGRVLWLTRDRKINPPQISLAKAREIARRYLEERGYKDMVPVYFETIGGMIIFNFAATQDKVVLYPDQVKVTIALDTGEVVGFEANAFYMIHHKRKLLPPRLTVTQARKKLSPRLQVRTNGRLVVIPTGPEQEKLTYEFQGQLGKDTFLIYINALDGQEEKILRLVRNQEGILAL
jgi:germination protein YpeB